jgi:hypothetical protein
VDGSSLNVSGNTTLNNATTINSSFNVVGNIIGSGTALTNLNYNAILNPLHWLVLIILQHLYQL